MTWSEDETATFTVLVVCQANICRSPTAQLLLSRVLAMEGIGGYVDVSSAGVRAVKGQPWCEPAARKVRAGDDRNRMRESHRSRRLERTMVERADLVLTAAREQRAAVVQLSPQATVRAFTLRESALLASAVADALVPQDTQLAGSSRAEGMSLTLSPLTQEMSPQQRLRWLVSEMHSARGLVRMPETGAQWPSWLPRRRNDLRGGIDIDDPHGVEHARHGSSQIQDAVQAWASAARLVVRFDVDEVPD